MEDIISKRLDLKCTNLKGLHEDLEKKHNIRMSYATFCNCMSGRQEFSKVRYLKTDVNTLINLIADELGISEECLIGCLEYRRKHLSIKETSYQRGFKDGYARAKKDMMYFLAKQRPSERIE